MSTPTSEVLLKLTAAMQLLAERLETQEHLISRDMFSFTSGLNSKLARIDLTLDAISKCLMVLHDKIEHIVVKEEITGNTETVQSPPVPAPAVPIIDLTETNSPPSLFQPWTEEDKDWLDSLMNSPEHTTSVDINCYETVLGTPKRLRDPILKYGGTMEHLVQGSPEKRTSGYQVHISRSPERSGGMGTCSRKKLS